MAFTLGVPAAVSVLVSDRMVRIHQPGAGAEVPFQLAAGATGTIGLFPKSAAPDIRLPAAFMPRPYEGPDSPTPVSLQDSVKVTVISTNPPAVAKPIAIVKTGTTPEDFQIAITNAGNAATGALEIYVEFH